MAVPEGKRTESKLAVQTKAIELATYTITICSKQVFGRSEFCV